MNLKRTTKKFNMIRRPFGGLFVLGLLTLNFQSCAPKDPQFAKYIESSNAQRTLLAKEEANELVFNKPMPGAFLSTKFPSQLPPGSTYDPESSTLSWVPDLQDIGKTFSGKIFVEHRNSEDSSQYNFKVIPPAINTVSCVETGTVIDEYIKPKELWHTRSWGGLKTTYSAPVAGDLDGDGDVEIVSVASGEDSHAYFNVNGPLVALNGKTGAIEWDSYDPRTTPIPFGVSVSTTPALADLDLPGPDNDGVAEIIAVQLQGNDGTKKIVIIDYKTKKIRHTSETFKCGRSCMVAVADIDEDGKAEIVAGNIVLNNDGTTKFFLEIEPTRTQQAHITTLADLIPDRLGLEIISNGAQVYSSKGEHIWSEECRGFTAVADLDKDGSPELVCSGAPVVWDVSYIYAYSSGGTQLWKIPTPGGFNSGAPNIGNFNEDKNLEIGVAGGSKYVVLNKDGGVVWEVDIVDSSSSSTGSTIFDFNGDGKVEVVYNDENKLRIYSGDEKGKGRILWETENLSNTLWEYPIIVDANNDGSADIVVSSPTLGGIRVFTDPNKKWVNTRKLWNQYSYYPEIVSDDLRVVPDPGIPMQGFRLNNQGTVVGEGRILKADLSVIPPLYPDSEGAPGVLTFYLYNQGEATSNAEKTLRLYNYMNFKIGELVVREEIRSGEGILVKIPVSVEYALDNGLRMEINLDSNGNLTSTECNAKNNNLSFELKGLSRLVR